ncbi:MAG: hypothetical protein SNJ63_07270 [Sphingomonadaceae bacterium]
MSSPVRKTFLLPDALARSLDEEAMASAQSVNAVLVARLQGEAAVRREKEQLAAEVQRLGAEVARLKADLATRPPPNFRDSLLRQTPGTAKLLDERDAARVACRKLESALAKAQDLRGKWRDYAEALKQERDDLGAELKRTEARCDRLVASGKEKDALLETRAQELSRTRADHEAKLERAVEGAFQRGMVTAVPTVSVLAVLLLFLVPADTTAMRFVASAAMGATMEPERAAARLHPQPLGGFRSQVQLYALAHTEKNGERLAACFERARQIPAKAKRQTVDCTIQVPGSLKVESTLLLKGPFELERPLRRQLRRTDTAEIDTAPAAAPSEVQEPKDGAKASPAPKSGAGDRSKSRPGANPQPSRRARPSPVPQPARNG